MASAAPWPSEIGRRHQQHQPQSLRSDEALTHGSHMTSGQLPSLLVVLRSSHSQRALIRPLFFRPQAAPYTQHSLNWWLETIATGDVADFLRKDAGSHQKHPFTFEFPQLNLVFPHGTRFANDLTLETVLAAFLKQVRLVDADSENSVTTDDFTAQLQRLESLVRCVDPSGVAVISPFLPSEDYHDLATSLSVQFTSNLSDSDKHELLFLQELVRLAETFASPTKRQLFVNNSSQDDCYNLEMTIFDITDWFPPGQGSAYDRPAHAKMVWNPVVIGSWGLFISNRILRNYVNHTAQAGEDWFRTPSIEFHPNARSRDRSALAVGTCSLPLASSQEFAPQFVDWGYEDSMGMWLQARWEVEHTQTPVEVAWRELAERVGMVLDSDEDALQDGGDQQFSPGSSSLTSYPIVPKSEGPEQRPMSGGVTDQLDADQITEDVEQEIQAFRAANEVIQKTAEQLGQSLTIGGVRGVQYPRAGKGPQERLCWEEETVETESAALHTSVSNHLNDDTPSSSTGRRVSASLSRRCKCDKGFQTGIGGCDSPPERNAVAANAGTTLAPSEKKELRRHGNSWPGSGAETGESEPLARLHGKGSAGAHYGDPETLGKTRNGKLSSRGYEMVVTPFNEAGGLADLDPLDDFEDGTGFSNQTVLDVVDFGLIGGTCVADSDHLPHAGRASVSNVDTDEVESGQPVIRDIQKGSSGVEVSLVDARDLEQCDLGLGSGHGAVSTGGMTTTSARTAPEQGQEALTPVSCASKERFEAARRDVDALEAFLADVEDEFGPPRGILKV